MFSMVSYHPGMPDTRSLRPATADEIAEALSFALRYQGRKRVNHADDAMARILLSGLTLVRHLQASGFVLMKGPPLVAPTTGGMPPGRGSGGGVFRKIPTAEGPVS